jgi:hypothetical protein
MTTDTPLPPRIRIRTGMTKDLQPRLSIECPPHMDLSIEEALALSATLLGLAHEAIFEASLFRWGMDITQGPPQEIHKMVQEFRTWRQRQSSADTLSAQAEKDNCDACQGKSDPRENTFCSEHLRRLKPQEPPEEKSHDLGRS